jgi:putative oxygen-independent coproporphyrinogen III oxidase
VTDPAVEASRFGVYVHVPFCRARCPYCDFAVVVGADEAHAAYVDAVLREADRWAARVAGRRVESVYLGGGTPSLLDPALLARLLAGLRAAFDVAPGAEVTVEANPETLDPGRVQGIRAAGATRLSIGAQSFVPEVLRRLGRAHDPGQVARAVRAARAAGFESVSLDLVYGTPGETLRDWETSLARALALAPDHLSAYALTVEPGTAFAARVAAGRMAPPDEDRQADCFEAACEALARAGYDHYEVSSWARPGRRCRHNLLYWTQGEYAGLGPGAHAHLDGVRSWNVRSLRAYLARSPEVRAGEERLDDAARAEEWLMLRLRLVEGLDLAEASRRLGLDLRAPSRALAALGLARPDPDRLVLTRRGILLLSEVTRLLAGPEERRLALSGVEC